MGFGLLMPSNGFHWKCNHCSLKRTDASQLRSSSLNFCKKKLIKIAGNGVWGHKNAAITAKTTYLESHQTDKNFKKMQLKFTACAHLLPPYFQHLHENSFGHHLYQL